MHDGTCESNALSLTARCTPHRAGRELTNTKPRDTSRPRLLGVDAREMRCQLDILPSGEVGVAERIMPHPSQSGTNSA